MRGDANPSEVQTVGVPACLDRDVGMCPLMSMTCTGSVQEPECRIREVEHQPTQFRGVRGGTRPVLRIATLVDPLRIMEDGEELHHLGIGTGLLG